MNPFAVVEDFENRIAEWANAPYAVSVESCTMALFLSILYRGVRGTKITIPKQTYVGVPCSIINSGNKVEFSDEQWEGIYELKPLKIIDSALRFKKDMYISGTLYCLSFHVKKILPIGRGSLILTDDIKARDWLRKARFDGRNPVPMKYDHFDMIGYNCYMTPEQASRGIQLFEVMRNKDIPDLKVIDQQYPNLDLFPIYKQ